METTNSLIQIIEESIRRNWNLDAMTDYKGATLQYKDVARKIEKMHILLEHAGIKKGDKIALCGRIMASGRHEELRESCPLYESMWQAHIGAKDGDVA